MDTSALVAIALHEPEADSFSLEIAGRGALVATTTLVEASTVLSRMERSIVEQFFSTFLGRASVQSVEFSLEMFEVAHDAYRQFGKGQGHPAQLNFGDCLSYAVAKVHDLPLLYKGNDFAHTDLVPAWRP